MSQKPADYEDDSTIADDAELWRRIPPRHIVPDNTNGGVRISKAAFEDHPNGSPMSVTLAKESLAAGRGAYALLIGHIDFCLASITAGTARSLKQGIMRKPLVDDPAHAEVFGKKTDSVRKKLSKAAKWVIAPQQLSDSQS